MRARWKTSELIEFVLISIAVLWGAILLLPGNSFAPANRIDLLAEYAPDWIWGIALLIFSLPFFFLDRIKYSKYFSAARVFYWIFWLSITLLATYRSADNGLSPVDCLLILPFLAIALIHAILYVSLEHRL
jgi:hypothetical protein